MTSIVTLELPGILKIFFFTNEGQFLSNGHNKQFFTYVPMAGPPRRAGPWCTSRLQCPLAAEGPRWQRSCSQPY